MDVNRYVAYNIIPNFISTNHEHIGHSNYLLGIVCVADDLNRKLFPGR